MTAASAASLSGQPPAVTPQSLFIWEYRANRREIAVPVDRGPGSLILADPGCPATYPSHCGSSACRDLGQAPCLPLALS